MFQLKQDSLNQLHDALAISEKTRVRTLARYNHAKQINLDLDTLLIAAEAKQDKTEIDRLAQAIADNTEIVKILASNHAAQMEESTGFIAAIAQLEPKAQPQQHSFNYHTTPTIPKDIGAQHCKIPSTWKAMSAVGTFSFEASLKLLLSYMTSAFKQGNYPLHALLNWVEADVDKRFVIDRIISKEETWDNAVKLLRERFSNKQASLLAIQRLTMLRQDSKTGVDDYMATFEETLTATKLPLSAEITDYLVESLHKRDAIKTRIASLQHFDKTSHDTLDIIRAIAKEYEYAQPLSSSAAAFTASTSNKHHCQFCDLMKKSRTDHDYRTCQSFAKTIDRNQEYIRKRYGKETDKHSKSEHHHHHPLVDQKKSDTDKSEVEQAPRRHEVTKANTAYTTNTVEDDCDEECYVEARSQPNTLVYDSEEDEYYPTFAPTSLFSIVSKLHDSTKPSIFVNSVTSIAKGRNSHIRSDDPQLGKYAHSQTLDTGANEHLIKDAHLVHDIRTLKHPVTVRGVSGHFTINQSAMHHQLGEVLFSKHLPCNLISFDLLRRTFDISYRSGDNAFIATGKKHILEFRRHKMTGLHILTETKPSNYRR